MARDITSRLERLEAFEERLGVTLESLSAFIEDHGDDSVFLTICGELHATTGTELQTDVELVVAAYDSSSRIVATSSHTCYAEDFFGLDTFSITASLPLKQLARVRVYPKKG